MGKTEKYNTVQTLRGKKNFPNCRGNKIYCNRKGNNFPEGEKPRSYGKTFM